MASLTSPFLDSPQLDLRRRPKLYPKTKAPPQSIKVKATTSSSDPLLLKAARGETISRPPAWMMRQAGRYMQSYKELAIKHPSFRQRSETVDLIVEIALQPWKAFKPDGVILFSDILTPLPAIGVPFDISDSKGPVIHDPVQSEMCIERLRPIDFDKVSFVGESLRILRNEVFVLFLLI